MTRTFGRLVAVKGPNPLDGKVLQMIFPGQGLSFAWLIYNNSEIKRRHVINGWKTKLLNNPSVCQLDVFCREKASSERE